MPGLTRQADELRQHGLVLLKAVVLQFDIVVFRTKQVTVPQGRLPGAVVVPRQQCLGDLARKTSRQADQAVVVFFQQLLVDAGL